jgi:sulfate/thiosulfate transport system permease protein
MSSGLLPKLLKPSVLPGLRLTMVFTLVYLLILVIIPLSGLFLHTATLSPTELADIFTSKRVLSAFRLTFTTAFIAALLNSLFGLIVAWVLVRYKFPGRKILDAIVDLPFALPTAVAGIALTAIYAPDGLIGRLLQPYHLEIAFTSTGIVIALILVGLPFVVRTVQPVLQEIGKDQEEAAACLGASRSKIFVRIIFPYITPSLLTGFALAFARAIGEYGSVIFIAGNIPRISEIVPLLIVVELEQANYAAASSIAAVMLIIAFMILFIINLLHKWQEKKGK